MKRIIYIMLFSLICFLPANAQIDRSVQPKPGPAPKINLKKPQSFQLANGLTVLVVENNKLPRVTFSLSLDNPPTVEGALKGIDGLTSSMMGNGTSKISKDDFNKQIEYYGANVYFGVNNVGGSTLSRYFPEVLSLAAQGGLDPLFTQEELDSERAKWIDALKADEKSAQSVVRNVYKVLTYGKDHPKGELVKKESLEKITLADIKKHYAENFVPENAYLVVVGDVKFDDVKKLVTEDFSSWKKAAAPKGTYADPANLSKTEINFVDIPNAVQTEIYMVNLTNLKMTDPDYFAALLANQVLGGGADGRLFLNLREAHGWTYGSYSGIDGDKYISNFTAYASVRNAVADSAVVEMLKELDKIRTTIPTEDELNLAKAKYVGSFVMNAEKPQAIASFAYDEKTQSLPANFYENYIQNVNAVTLEQVKTAAQKYILHDGTRIVIAGKASEVLPNLEKLNIPIKYFDIYANPTSKPEEKKAEEGVTAQTVLNKYINAVGGKQALEAVKSIAVTYKATVQGNEITLVQKSTADGKSSQEMTAMGMTLTKAVFDGQKGYVMMQGQKKDLEEAEIKDMKYSVPFPELMFLASDIKLNGVEDNSYVLTLGDKSYYYDITSGLKTGEAATKEIMPGQTVTQKVSYSDYRDVKGVKVPYKLSMNMGMEIELNISDVKINEGVADSDFQ
ncbi:MAG: M16 family metallopeptidase [Dysgonomonas sp.]